MVKLMVKIQFNNGKEAGSVIMRKNEREREGKENCLAPGRNVCDARQASRS